jgi:hypothetical protein
LTAGRFQASRRFVARHLALFAFDYHSSIPRFRAWGRRGSRMEVRSYPTRTR